MVSMVDGLKILAVIPARGGSMRIPRKNIIDFCELPMIAWTIQAASQVEFIDKIVVSTDDIEIAEISKKYGAEVPFLREQYADDYTPVSTVSVNCLNELEKQCNENYDIIIQLMVNCPNRNSSDIIAAVKIFLKNKSDFQISCFKYGWMNPWWAHTINDDFSATPIFDDEIKDKRSQDQQKLFCPTGAIWIAKVKSLLTEKTFYGKGYTFVPIPWTSAIDIDDYEDLKMAKIIRSMLKNDEKGNL